MSDRFTLIKKATALYTTGAVRALSADSFEVADAGRLHVADRLNGAWRCTCTGFRFRPDRACSHILAGAALALVITYPTPAAAL